MISPLVSTNILDGLGILDDLGLPDPSGGARIVVAMSGGVDSSVVAALLARAGYDVVGVTLQLYDHGKAVHRSGACCAGEDIRDARRVAERLAIPHYVLDYEARFESAVMNAFADSYLSGETPVPCVTCNSRIKFTDLVETARQLGAAALATGHYVTSRRLRDGARGGDDWALYRARDGKRDQSYFLFATTREQLSFLRFPLGSLRKPQVRALARQFALPVAAKRDSQDICFVPTGRYTQVIERLRPGAAEAGEIVHVDGRVLGSHDGIINYTVGQRRGIGVAAGEPLYVVRIDAERRRVIVGPRLALRTRHLILREMNWLGDGEGPDAGGERGLAIHARVRSTQPPVAARLYQNQKARRECSDRLGAKKAEAGRVTVTLNEEEEGVSPGQACVLYDGPAEEARVLGGGWIAETSSTDVHLAPTIASASPTIASESPTIASESGVRRRASRPSTPPARARAS